MHVFLVRMICNFTIGCAHEIRIGSTLGRSGTNSFAIVQTIKLKKNDCVYIQKSNLLVINVSSRLYSTPSIASNNLSSYSICCMLDRCNSFLRYVWNLIHKRMCFTHVLILGFETIFWPLICRRSSPRRFFALKEKYRSA